MIKAALCDDNVAVTGQMEKYIYDIAQKHQLKVECEIFFSGEALLENMQQGNYYDLLYLDIEIPGKQSGVDIANTIREKGWPVLIVYVSSYENYMKEICATEPFAFLSKPVNERELEDIFLKAVQRISRRPEYFSYSYQKHIAKIPLSSIICFESKGKMVFIHTVEEKVKKEEGASERKFYGKINEVERGLKNSNTCFLRIHQSYLVNYEYIREMGFTQITLEDGRILQISKKRQKAIREQFCLLAGGMKERPLIRKQEQFAMI